MSLPRRQPEHAELLAGSIPESAVSERPGDERSGTPGVRYASDDAIARSIKRVTRDHRALLVALSK